MPEIKPHLKNLLRTRPREKSRRGYLRLDMNEAVPGLPEDFAKEMLSGIDAEFLAMYPEYKALQESVANHNHLQPKNICLSNGSDAAIKYIFDAYVMPEDKVLLVAPSFAMYPVYCQMFGAQAVIIEYHPDLTFPKDDFVDRISPDIKLAVVVNPNNPTGSAVEQQTLTLIVKKAQEHGVLVIVDEAYFYFYPETIIGEVKKFDNLIVLRTFSKLCALASARLGYAAACPEIIENLNRVKPTYDVNGLAVLFGQSILSRPEMFRDLVESAQEGKRYLTQKLTEVGIEYKAGWANFVLIKCGQKTAQVVSRLAEKKILVGSGFSQDFLKGYIRVTVGNQTAMQRFWQAFIEIWPG